MVFPGEVGLQLLLCPLNSNIVVRTACCSVGIVLPVYSTFKAIEKKDQSEQQRWLLYWAAYGSFSVAELFADKILSWFPLYYHMKFAFLVWLQLPSANNGTSIVGLSEEIDLVNEYPNMPFILGAHQLYMSYLRPFLLKHQARLDQIVEFLYCEMNKFVSAHQAEFQFAKALLMKILASVNHMVRDIIHPDGRQANGAFEGRGRRIQGAQSDDED